MTLITHNDRMRLRAHAQTARDDVRWGRDYAADVPFLLDAVETAEAQRAVAGVPERAQADNDRQAVHRLRQEVRNLITQVGALEALAERTSQSAQAADEQHAEQVAQWMDDAEHARQIRIGMERDLARVRDLNRTQSDAVRAIGEALGVKVISLEEVLAGAKRVEGERRRLLEVVATVEQQWGNINRAFTQVGTILHVKEGESTLDAARAYAERVAELDGRLAAATSERDEARAMLDGLMGALGSLLSCHIASEPIIEAVRQLGYAHRRAEQSLRDMHRNYETVAAGATALQEKLAAIRKAAG